MIIYPYWSCYVSKVAYHCLCNIRLQFSIWIDFADHERIDISLEKWSYIYGILSIHQHLSSHLFLNCPHLRSVKQNGEDNIFTNFILAPSVMPLIFSEWYKMHTIAQLHIVSCLRIPFSHTTSSMVNAPKKTNLDLTNLTNLVELDSTSNIDIDLLYIYITISPVFPDVTIFICSTFRYIIGPSR